MHDYVSPGIIPGYLANGRSPARLWPQTCHRVARPTATTATRTSLLWMPHRREGVQGAQAERKEKKALALQISLKNWCQIPGETYMYGRRRAAELPLHSTSEHSLRALSLSATAARSRGAPEWPEQRSGGVRCFRAQSTCRSDFPWVAREVSFANGASNANGALTPRSTQRLRKTAAHCPGVSD